MSTKDQKSESILELVSNIEKGNVILPEFQRDFVWDIMRTFDLFDSLVRDIFIGSIIYGNPSFEITVREIDIRPRKVKGKRRAKLNVQHFTKDQIAQKTKIDNFRLILDGQQRATSIYRALKGVDDVWFIVKNPEEMDQDTNEKEFEDVTLEELLYEFSGNQDEERLSIKLSDVFLTATKGGYRETKVKTEFFDHLDFLAGYSEEEVTKEFDRYLEIKDKIQVLLRSDKLLSYYLLDMDNEKFALFFERSNSKAVQLNFIDILAAKLYNGFNLREHIDDLQSNYPIENFVFNREIIVRAIAYIVSDGKDVDRKYILTNLNAVHFNDYWNEICESYKKVIDFLSKQNFIISQSWMPYENMIIPLVNFLRHIKGNDFSQMNESQFEFITYWYWSSIMTQRYSSGSNEAIIQDSFYLSAIARGEKITEKSYFNKLKIKFADYEDIISMNRKGSVIYKGLLNLVNFSAGGLTDISNSSKLSFNSKVDDHHIFPREYLKDIYKKEDDVLTFVDSVANRMLVPKITNIIIGKKSPSIYLQELEGKNIKLKESLESHIIPIEVLEGSYDEFFEVFLEERAKKLFDLLQKRVIDKEENILEEHYKRRNISDSGSRKVFASYRKDTVEATFDIETGKILYKGIKHSVSAAADMAKQDLSGKANTSTNGWTFWKYKNEEGETRSIKDFRKDS